MNPFSALLPWFVLLPLCGMAAGATLPGLPSDEVVRRVLASRPEALASNSDVEAGAAQRDRLVSGTYEWAVRLGSQQRRTAPPAAPEARFTEWNAVLERPLRLPGKAGIDSDLGDATLARAHSARDDSLHEARRTLLQDWFDWRAEQAALRLSAMLLDSHRRQSDAILQRLALGDAARLESVQAQAALSRAQLQHQELQAAEARLREQLRRRYPGLPLPDEALPEPSPLPGTEASWVSSIVERSHAIALASHDLRLAELAAARNRADQTPDPSIGVAISRERGGEDHVLGAFVSIPLAGAGRAASGRATVAAADAARQRYTAMRREVELQAVTQVRLARSALETWRSAYGAANSQQTAADMAQRAYQLGEGTFNELLLARRLADEARQLAVRRQSEALLVTYRVMLDAEQLWADEETDGRHPVP